MPGLPHDTAVTPRTRPWSIRSGRVPKELCAPARTIISAEHSSRSMSGIRGIQPGAVPFRKPEEPAWIASPATHPAAAPALDEASFGDLSNDCLAASPWQLDGTSVGQNGETGHNVLSGRIQELAVGSPAYRFNLVLAAVPEPSAAALLLAGMLPARQWRRA